MQGFIGQTLNGVTYAGLLFLVGSGFTLIFGLMRIVNLAHGGAYLLGGYVGYSTLLATSSLWLAVAAGAISMAALGVVLERGLLLRLRGYPMAELLLTMGVAFILGDMALAIWGGDPRAIKMPGVLDRSSHLGPLVYPNSRLFILGVAVAVALLLYYLMARTRIGAIIRAGVDDREMVSALGINIDRVFTAVFILGVFLAGLAGVLGGSFLTLAPGSDSDILTFAIVVVIVGGLGSLPGAIVGSLVVGLVDNYAKAYFPDVAYFSLFAPMVLILLVRPQGLLGRSRA
jgi:branched-chain amino acid transport system permease protein